MKKGLLLLMLLVLLHSCSEDDNVELGLGQAYFTIERNGDSFSQDVDVYSNFGVDNCVADSYTLELTGSAQFIETSEFDFQMGIIHPMLDTDFVEISEVVEKGFGAEGINDGCFNIYDGLFIYDEFNKSMFVDVGADNFNRVTEVIRIEEQGLSNRYAVKGNYKITFTDGEGYFVTISGDYVLHVEGLI